MCVGLWIPGRPGSALQVNVPKAKRAFCKGCKKHMMMKVTQYKTGKASLYAQGERRRRQPRRMAPQLLTAGMQQQRSSSAAHLRGAAAGRRVFGMQHGLHGANPLPAGPQGRSNTEHAANGDRQAAAADVRASAHATTLN